jgi:hypothetical protein
MSDRTPGLLDALLAVQAEALKKDATNPQRRRGFHATAEEVEPVKPCKTCSPVYRARRVRCPICRQWKAT